MHDKKTFGINFRKAQKASGKKDQELAELLDRESTHTRTGGHIRACPC